MSSQLLADMRIPEGEERQYLLDGLANLIRRRGHAPFVLWPILTSDPRFFPDEWEKSPRGIRTLLRRLIRYAGLEQYELMLHVYDQPARFVDPHTQLVPEHEPTQAAAWYAGIDAGAAHFGVDVDQLRHAPTLVGTLGHEVAHLYRDHHELTVTDRPMEEALTDLTAIYLGFGLFLFESSYGFHTGGYSREGQPLAWERSMLGYLTLGSMALYLGAQLACRGVSKAELRRVTQQLPANQAALLRDAHAELSQDPISLRARLGVPPPDGWGAPPDLSELTAALPVEPDAAYIHEGADDGIVDDAGDSALAVVEPDPPNDAELDASVRDAIAERLLSGEPVSLDQIAALMESAVPEDDEPARHASAELGKPSLLPAMVGAAVGFAGGAYFGLTASLLLGAGGVVAGAYVARSDRGHRCSACHTELKTGIDWCPGCDAEIEW